MNTYKVTLNFTFRGHSIEDDYDDSYGDEEDMIKKPSEKQMAFQRTDQYFAKHSIEDYVKSNNALSFVEYLVCEGEILTAEWDKEKFAIHMLVSTDLSKKYLREELEMNSLEDSEYEACGDTGWIVMTRGPNDDGFGSPWDMKGFWEYGLTDYRNNPIEIERVE